MEISNIQFSVIIVSYKNYKVIEECLKSIDKFNDIGEKLEVIIVEQSESKEMLDKIKNIKTNTKVSVYEHENKGFGSGNNFGFSKSHGTYLLFLNPDTILVEPIFQFAINKLSDNQIGLFGVHLTDREGKDNLSYNEKINFGAKHLIANRIFKNRVFNGKTMYPNGADLFVRTNVFSECGKFDENIFMYGEETDVSNRILEKGYTVCYFSEKRIIHLEGQSTNSSGVYNKLCDSFIYVSKKFNVNYKKYFYSEWAYYRLKLIFHLYKNQAEKEILIERSIILKSKMNGKK